MVGGLTHLTALVAAACWAVCVDQVAAFRSVATGRPGGEGLAKAARSNSNATEGEIEVQVKAKRIPWTLAAFPNPKIDLELCGRFGKVSHICDPDNVLFSSLLDVEDRELMRMAKKPRGRPFGSLRSSAGKCKEEGVQVYVAVVGEIDAEDVERHGGVEEAAQTFAKTVGQQWGVLGGACRNGVVVVYSVADKHMSIQPDTGLGDHVGQPLSAEMLRRLVHNALRGGGATLPNDALATAIEQLNSALDGSLTVQLMNVERFTVFLHVLIGFLGTSLSFVAICCLYDAVGSWRHASRFRRCRKKVERVHDLFTKRQACAEFPLCAICLDYLPSARRKGSTGDAASLGAVCVPEGPHVVRFLCGHTFHTDCVNEWFECHSEESGRCPICELPHYMSAWRPAVEEGDVGGSPNKATASAAAFGGDEGQAECRCEGSDGEMKAFLLRSLREQHPEIVTEGNARRWLGCHVELWLAELTNPAYKSIWRAPEAER